MEIKEPPRTSFFRCPGNRYRGAGANFSPHGLKDAIGQRQDQQRYDSFAGQVAAYGIQRVLRAEDFALAQEVHGESGPVYYPRIFLPGEDDIPEGIRSGGISIKGLSPPPIGERKADKGV